MGNTSQAPMIVDEPINGPVTWRGESLPDAPLQVSAACGDELHRLVDLLRANPLPLESLRPADFDLPLCRGLMASAQSALTHGVGFVLIDRLPIEFWSLDETRAVTWLLCSMVERPVAQKWDGVMIYDVLDKGAPVGNGVRADVTNAGQNFHTDNSYNLCAPWYVALLCWQTAQSGGISSVVSLHTAHNIMRERHPDLLARLYQDFTFDRQREHAPNDTQTVSHAIFESGGDLGGSFNGSGAPAGRISRALIDGGYRLAGTDIDPLGRAALEAFDGILNETGMAKTFFFEPGQIQIVDNRRCAHRRTAFTDWPEPERRRHLVRLWLRGAGRTFYNG